MKKQLKLITIWLFLLGMPTTLLAQNQELKIGDKVPDLIVTKLIHSQKKQVKLSNLYKKGLLIIDFWATWCSPCLAELPAADSLVGTYSHLAVLSVSHDDSLTTSLFLKKHPKIKRSRLTITSDDKALSEYFPHKIIPHNIWIDRHGTIKLITGSESVNERNIRAILRDSLLTVAEKKEDINFNMSKPYHVPDDKIEYRSIITHHNDSIPAGLTYNGALSNGTSRRIFSFNSAIVDLYWLAYVQQQTCFTNWDFVELHCKDSVKFRYPQKKDTRAMQLLSASAYNKNNMTVEEQIKNWEKENTYCYDLILPKTVSSEVFADYMFNDLNRYFNLTGKIETRDIVSPVLVTNPNYDTTKFKKFIPEADYIPRPSRYFKWSGNTLVIQDRTFAQIIAYLIGSARINFDQSSFPFVNETGFDYPVRMTLYFPEDREITSALVYDILAKAGLTFIKARRNVPVLALYER